MAAVGLVSSVLSGALRSTLREAAESQRAAAIVRLPCGRNVRSVCAVAALPSSDPDSAEQGAPGGSGARVLVASGAGRRPKAGCCISGVLPLFRRADARIRRSLSSCSRRRVSRVQSGGASPEAPARLPDPKSSRRLPSGAPAPLPLLTAHARLSPHPRPHAPQGLLGGGEPSVSLERETKLLAAGSAAAEAAGSARWLLDSPESQGGGSGGSPSNGPYSAGGSAGSGGQQQYAEHLERSLYHSLSQSIIMAAPGGAGGGALPFT